MVREPRIATMNQRAAGILPAARSLRLVPCPTPEAEATLAAHEILQHVRAGGRYRDGAVLVRSLDGYHDVLRRVFHRFNIPFFLDRREPVAHHPLAELTRSALRTVAFGWKQEDWFAVWKTGLLPASDADLDWLENTALEHGWDGSAWREPLSVPAQEALSQDAERLRQRLVPPFLALSARLAESQFQPTGAQLAGALRELWETLEVERQLTEWASRAGNKTHSALHTTVWSQMQSWLDNLARAFSAESLPLREWLPILEAGLSGLTVGVIPPALDQVLIGAIDRSRNPDLQLALVLGLNEGVFPAPLPPAVLLTDLDRDELENHRVFLGPGRKLRLGHERYFGYIACTRTRRRLVLAWAASDDSGAALNSSLFIDHIKRMFPDLKEEPHSCLPSGDEDVAAPAWLSAQHASELAPFLLRNQSAPPAAQSPSLAALENLPVFLPLLAKWGEVNSPAGARLAPGVPEKLFGQELSSSVSALEEYAACPFKFFVARGLRAEERKHFEIDERERGTFQHEALKIFHWRLRNQGRRWRDVSVVEACVMIRQIGEDLGMSFRNGLFAASDAGRFHTETLIAQLENLVAALIGWARQYEFDPVSVEVDFGFPESPLPAWRLPLDNGRELLLRGRIDRIDFCATENDDEVMAAVIDYKSTVRPLDATKLHHGLQLQLLSYLGVLRGLKKPRTAFSVDRIVPAGVFYVGLRGGSGSGSTRAEVLASREEARNKAYQHTGRFNAEALRQFDNRPDATSGDQFKYRLKNDGTLSATSPEALSAEQFGELLNSVEAHLRRIGREIFAGEAPVSPFRKNTETACQYCDFRPVCRFDPWTEPYRVLRLPPQAEEEKPEPKSKTKKARAQKTKQAGP